jgi:HEAT repeat protein
MGSRLSPAYGLALAAAGFFAGVVALRLVPTLGAPGAGPAPIGAAVSPGASVSNILSLESAPDRDHVRLSYDTSQRAQIEGSAADPAIRDLLVATVRDSLNAGLRLEAIEALGRHTENDEVRRTLIGALLADDNAGARLRAIEALHGRMGVDADVRRAMLEAVRSDANPGVRVRAIDLLSAGRDEAMLPAMELLARDNPDTYIRMRSTDFVDAMHARARR